MVAKFTKAFVFAGALLAVNNLQGCSSKEEAPKKKKVNLQSDVAELKEALKAKAHQAAKQTVAQNVGAIVQSQIGTVSSTQAVIVQQKILEMQEDIKHNGMDVKKAAEKMIGSLQTQMADKSAIVKQMEPKLIESIKKIDTSKYADDVLSGVDALCKKAKAAGINGIDEKAMLLAARNTMKMVGSAAASQAHNTYTAMGISQMLNSLQGQGQQGISQMEEIMQMGVGMSAKLQKEVNKGIDGAVDKVKQIEQQAPKITQQSYNAAVEEGIKKFDELAAKV